MAKSFFSFVIAMGLAPVALAVNATIGTGSAVGVDIQTNSTTAMSIDTSQNIGIGTAPGTDKMCINGNINLVTANTKIIANTGLTFESQGDTYGTVRLNLQNRNGVNGAMFEQAGSVDLVDFVFKGLANQRNIRYENRAGSALVGAPEFEIGTAADPTIVITDSVVDVRKGKFGVNTTAPGGLVTGNNTTTNSTTFEATNGAAVLWKVNTPTNAAATSYNAASAVEYVAKDNTTSRSINAAGSVSTNGGDFAEWVDWSGEHPPMGSVINYRGSYVVVSSPETVAFVGNDSKNQDHAILVAFAGQLPVLVRGVVTQGDLIVGSDDGVARAVPKAQATVQDAYRAVGTAWSSSLDTGVKRVHVAVGIGLAGGLRDIQQLKEENANLKARLERLENLLSAKH